MLKKKWIGIGLLSTAMLMTSCLTINSHSDPVPPAPEDHAAYLIKHKDFEKAKEAAPEWVLDALNMITYLDGELQRAQR